MANYFVNKNEQSTGENEVHREGCEWLKKAKDVEYLGDYPSCHSAVAEAKRRGYNADGCYYCCNDCHTR